jgi:putative N6-adenine-specific DNA methylase
MCGSGTLLTEAGLIARNIAPGKYRRYYGFQSWKDYDAELFESIRDEAAKQEKEKIDFRICGCDHSPGAIRTAMENIKGAGLEDTIDTEISDFAKFMPPEGGGTLMVNPPYGERLKPNDLARLYKEIGDTLKSQYSGYTAWILTSSEEGFKNIGLRPSRKIPLYNGPLECRFLKYELYRGSKKAKYNPQE